MEELITLVPALTAFEMDSLEGEFAAREDCFRDPREGFSARWAFIVHASQESRARIQYRLDQDPRSAVIAGFVAGLPDGTLQLTIGYPDTPTLIIMRDIAQQLMDKYQPRVLNSIGIDRTDEAAGRADIFFPSGLSAMGE